MTEEELERKFREKFPLLVLEMNEPQEKFIRCKNSKGITPRRRLLEAGNKVGKCICFDTLINTPQGEQAVGELYEKGKPFQVYSWDGEKKVIANATAPFKKQGLHQCYRISFSDNTFLSCADYHRVLSDKGWLFVQHLYEYFQDPQESTSESFLPILSSGVVHLSEKQLDFQYDYPVYPHLYDELPQKAKDNGRVFAPLTVCVREYNRPFLQRGVQDNRYKYILSELYDRLSNLDVLRHYGGLCVESLSRVFYRFVQWHSHLIPNFLQLSTVGTFQPQSLSLSSLNSPHLPYNHLASYPPILEYGNKIHSITAINRLQEVYDFEVEKYHNYFAGGLIHHNTEIGIAEDIAHAVGYRPWLGKDDPNYKINVKVPNQGLIACETIQHSIAEKIEPALRRLIPEICRPVFKPGPTGVLSRVTLQDDGRGGSCGSKIYLRSYDSKPDSFEGIDYEWEHFDEPPPEKHLEAAERGKIATNAPSWFTMTPLKEPHIFDKFSSRAPFDDEIEVIRAEIWDNCMDWCKKCDVEIPENSNGERVVYFCPSCKKVLGFITKFGIEEYLKTLDPETREAREFGVWKHLSGLVYKEVEYDTHTYEDFEIPRSWMKVEGIDPHDARPVYWLFGAVSPEEIEIFGKLRHRIYFYDKLLLTGSMVDIAKRVKSTRAFHRYSEPAFVMLDKKHGDKTQMEDKSWHSELMKNGINRIRLSQSDPGDVDIGHKVVREYLKNHYSTLLGKSKPGMLFARKACGGENSPIHYMTHYQWKDGKDKPEEKYKDWPDCIRYIAMEQPVYRSPEDEIRIIEMIGQRKEQTLKMRRGITRGVVHA